MAERNTLGVCLLSERSRATAAPLRVGSLTVQEAYINSSLGYLLICLLYTCRITCVVVDVWLIDHVFIAFCPHAKLLIQNHYHMYNTHIRVMMSSNVHHVQYSPVFLRYYHYKVADLTV